MGGDVQFESSVQLRNTIAPRWCAISFADLHFVSVLSRSLIKKNKTTRKNSCGSGELKQNGGNWTKYGITFKTGEKYFYLTAIPINKDLVPDHFINKEIPKGEYEMFTHKGKMESIKRTLYKIYKNIVPKSNLIIEDYKKIGFLHFEKYDYRFKWNKPNSMIDIYLPIKTNK